MFEAALGAAALWLSRDDDGLLSKLRQTRRELDAVLDSLIAFASRGELVRLRQALAQDFLSGLLLARRAQSAIGAQLGPRPALNPDGQTWPPAEGQYDAQGLVSRLGEMAVLGLALTYEEPRSFLIGLTQATPPTDAAKAQIGRASRALVSVVSSLALELRGYETAWRRLFTGNAGSTIDLSGTAPPDVGVSGAAGSATVAARADHTHGHGNQAGGLLHALATSSAPGFLSDADKAKLDGIAPGATATPLATTAPPSVAAASATGAASSAARSDHTHAHGDQAGGTLHAVATAAAAGFLAASDKAKLDGIAIGATATPLGVLPPPAVATAGAAGTANSAARSDHTHAHGDQGGGTLHALATPLLAGFLSAADKAKLDSLSSPLPDVFVVTPGGTLPYYSSIQSAINAATSAGERTAADPAVVLVLPGSYTENVTLKKHVMVIGWDRLGDYETILNGGVTCNLTLEGGVRDLTCTVWRGISIFNPAGTPGINFTGTSSQKLLLHDTSVEGSDTGLLMDNLFTAGTGTSQVLADRCRFRSTAAGKLAVRVSSGALELQQCDLWNRLPVGGPSSMVLAVGPAAASARPASATLTNCAIEGLVSLDGSLCTLTAANQIGLSLTNCTHTANTGGATPPAFYTVQGNGTVLVTGMSITNCILGASNWTAGFAVVRGVGATPVLVYNGGNRFGAAAGSSAATLTSGTAVYTALTAL